MTTNNNKILARLINALNFDWKTRPDLINSISQTEKVTVFAEDGTPIETEVTFFISVDSMKQFTVLLKKKAEIPDDFTVSIEP